MTNIYLISDHHFGHKHIIEYESRPFIDIDKMDEYMIQVWNTTVKPSDKVFHLGDFSFRNKEKTLEIVKKLNGHKYLIMGNHDRGHSLSWFRDVGFKNVYDCPILYADFFIFSHIPKYTKNISPYFNIHGHTHSSIVSDNNRDKQYHYNVSVELLNYKPINFEEIKEKLNEQN